MEDKAKCRFQLYWHNCYAGGFALWSDDAYSHPAKMSPALCYRILEHLRELGLLKEGDTILDPMAGIGTTNICAGAMGYPSISVELEEKFIDFEKQNKEYAERRLFKSLDWKIVKGDSRRLSELLRGEGLKSITSPPYGNTTKNLDDIENWDKEKAGRIKEIQSLSTSMMRPYSDNPNNIGNLKDKPLKSIFSPPYGEALSGGGIAQYGHYSDPELANRIYSAENTNPSNIEKQIERVKRGKAKMKRPDVFTSEGNKAAKGYFEGNYSRNPENIGNLKDAPLKAITSPPYGETGVGDWKTGRAEFQAWVINEIKTKGYVEWQGKRYNEAEWRAMNHGRIDGRTTKGVHKHPTDGYNPENEDNIGNLPDKPLKSITSPPYGDAEKRDRSIEASGEKEKTYPRGDHNISAGYQGSDDNIGKLSDKPLKSVMSPPYEGGGHHKGMLDSWGGENTPVSHKTKDDHGYGNTEGQIERAESYLDAMQKVYSEIARVSDVLAVVVKNPTRSGRLRRLDLDTISILEMSGWRIHCQHRALLFEELEQGVMIGETDMLVTDLSRAVEKPRFGYTKVITPVDDDEDYEEFAKEYPNLKPNTIYYAPQVPSGTISIDGKRVDGRLSFFKRLSWQKGQPVANFEDVLIAVRK